MRFRNEIQVAGIPVIWDTNLGHDDIRNLHAVLINDPDFLQAGIKARKEQGLAISLHLFQKKVNFKDGFCLCYGFKNKMWVMYRSTCEWEMWAARQAEIAELKEEQNDQLRVEELLFHGGDQYFREKILEAIKCGRFDEAADLIEQRFEHAKTTEELIEKTFHCKLPHSWRVCADAITLFRKFPNAEQAIAFLQKHARHWNAYFKFAESCYILKQTQKERVFIEIEKVFRVAVQKYPSEGMLFKKICLLWEKAGKIGLAIEFCRLAIERNLHDDTKNGFPLRLQRLLKKAELLKSRT
jgi:tetratricopeptide (TPR) repeat protein